MINKHPFFSRITLLQAKTSLDEAQNTGLFISPSGISELDCATTKTDTAERSISTKRERERDTPSFCPILQVLDMCTLGDFWGLLTNVSWTRSTVSADRPGRPVRFAAHKQLLCWNFVYHSRIVLSVGGSVWYMIRNLRCTVRIDSVLANFKTQNAFLFTMNAIFRCDYPLAVEPASTPRRLVQKFGEILYLLICSFLPCLSWLLRSRVQKSRRDLWITLYNRAILCHSVRKWNLRCKIQRVCELSFSMVELEIKYTFCIMRTKVDYTEG